MKTKVFYIGLITINLLFLGNCVTSKKFDEKYDIKTDSGLEKGELSFEKVKDKNKEISVPEKHESMQEKVKEIKVDIDPRFPNKCGDKYVNVKYDSEHCGKCFNSCGYVGGPFCRRKSKCENGRCRVICSAKTCLCFVRNNAYCADLGSDPEHCGACNKQCQLGQICKNGTCI